MKDRLSCITAIVDHHAVARNIELLLGRDVFCHEEEVADDLAIGNENAVDIGNVKLRHDQDVDRCLRIQVLECDGILVLMNDLRRDPFLDDLAENAVLI